jgi:putative endonuclease
MLRWPNIVLGARLKLRSFVADRMTLGGVMLMENIICVYIMSNVTKMLYTGVSSDLEKRVFEDRLKNLAGFTKEYNLFRLVYFETCSDVRAAIRREKEIKGWRRSKKVALIESINPGWKYLAADHSKSGAKFTGGEKLKSMSS